MLGGWLLVLRSVSFAFRYKIGRHLGTGWDLHQLRPKLAPVHLQLEFLWWVGFERGTVHALLLRTLGGLFLHPKDCEEGLPISSSPSLLAWRPSPPGWRPSLLGWRPSLLGWRPSLLGWRPEQSLSALSSTLMRRLTDRPTCFVPFAARSPGFAPSCRRKRCNP